MHQLLESITSTFCKICNFPKFVFWGSGRLAGRSASRSQAVGAGRRRRSAADHPAYDFGPGPESADLVGCTNKRNTNQIYPEKCAIPHVDVACLLHNSMEIGQLKLRMIRLFKPHSGLNNYADEGTILLRSCPDLTP